MGVGGEGEAQVRLGFAVHGFPAEPLDLAADAHVERVLRAKSLR